MKCLFARSFLTSRNRAVAPYILNQKKKVFTADKLFICVYRSTGIAAAVSSHNTQHCLLYSRAHACRFGPETQHTEKAHLARDLGENFQFHDVSRSVARLLGRHGKASC